MGTAHDEGIHPSVPQFAEIALRHQAGYRFVLFDKAAFHQRDEKRAIAVKHLDLWVDFREHPAVGTAVDRCGGPDHADAFVVRSKRSGEGCGV